MHHIKFGVAAGALLFAADASHAQSYMSNDDNDVVVVTGTKRNLSIQKTETSVSVINAEMIADQSLFSIDDVIQRTANVSLGGQGSMTELSIRGVSLLGVGYAGTGVTSTIYVDGAPASINTNYGSVNLWDMSQIEILRGPQSTVQGRNALSGAVVIQTADPEYQFSAKSRVIVGNHEHRNYSGVVTGPIIEDQVAFRFSIDKREYDFNVRDVRTDKRQAFEDAITYRAKLLVEPEFLPNLRVELIGERIDADSATAYTYSPVPVSDPAFADFDPFGSESYPFIPSISYNASSRAIVDVSYEINNNWDVYALGTYERTDADWDYDLFGYWEGDDKTYSAELRTAFNFSKLTGWVGAYYYKGQVPIDYGYDVIIEDFGFPTNPPGASLSIQIDRLQETENYAFFGDATYQFNDKWSLNLGARMDYEDYYDTGLQGSSTASDPSCTMDYFGFLIPCVSVIAVSNDPPTSAQYDAFLPRGSLNYYIDDLRMLAFSVQKGYRAGGTYIRNVPGELVETGTYDPEYLTNYEIAWRSQWMDQRITLNANAYYSDWVDQQVTIPGPSGNPLDSMTDNIGESILYGLEVDFAYDVNPNLDVFASLGLQHTEFTSFPYSIDADGNPANPDDPTYAYLDGNAFNLAPELNLSAGFTYNHPSGFFATGSAAYSSEQYSDVENIEANKGDAYTLINARLGYRNDTVEVALFANNLFDERFVSRKRLYNIDRSAGTISENTNPWFSVNNPRFYGISVSTEF